MITVHKVRWLPFNIAGIMLFGHVFIIDGLSEEAHRRTVKHEYKHVLQYEENWPWFYALYVWELIWRGYWENKFEVEARKFAESSAIVIERK